MVPFCLKSYNIVAPYENLDDDYASKIGKSAVAFTSEVTVSESEIAELEKPKVREVKPKDIEVEKPKVSKVDKAAEVKTFFLKLYEKMKVHITDNPDMLYKDYWRNGEH
ncbi:hypothetical protein SAMN04487761_10129 [Lachnospiraceae bacterium C7]|nr:hypothetical protein SAMN04487761_10129 [Lachnospiraceae bacterium C7]